ncbi:MAG TPA: protein kinase [Blastocatellia bacterium]|nr:protein kinase [Blastocatellia bacterium]
MPVCPKCNTSFEDDANFCKFDGTSLIPLSSETHLPLGVLINESLRVVERLRTDRFGVVYRVEDEIGSSQTYALRLFRRGLVNSTVFGGLQHLAQRLREALNERDFLTDYIPIQLEDGRYALLAADYPGVTLDSVIVAEAPLKPSFVVTTLTRIADVVSQAHRSGLVHGNITPENVLVVDRNERGLNFKVSDFGIASTIREHNPRALTALSGMARLQSYDSYYAPELVTGRSVAADERTDIYSLGALCYQMLSGWVPFTESAIEGEVAVYLTHDPRPLTVLNKELGIPRTLEETMLKALEVDPTERHQKIGDLIEALQEIEFDLSILQAPVAPEELEPPRGLRPSSNLSRSGELAEIQGDRARSTDRLEPRHTGEEKFESETDEEPGGSRSFDN